MSRSGRTARIWAVRGRGRHDLAGVVEQHPGHERDVLAPATTPPRPVSRPAAPGAGTVRAGPSWARTGPGPSVAITAGPRVASSIAASSPPWITPTRSRNCSVAVNATSIVPASGSIATGSQPSSAAAGGGAARPSIKSQNGPSRITRHSYRPRVTYSGTRGFLDVLKCAGHARMTRIWAVAVAAATTWPESSSSSPAMNAMSLPRRTTRPRPVSRPGCAGRRNCTCRSAVGAN